MRSSNPAGPITSKRAYYRAHDVTKLLRRGENAIGAIVADGWYAGYVGYGLLVGRGPNQVGRYFYGKTPAFMAQMEIEYADGSRETVVTDASWQVSSDGPVREADMIMGEAFDATQRRRELVRASVDGPSRPRSGEGVEMGIRHSGRSQRQHEGDILRQLRGARSGAGIPRPPRLQAYAAPPIRVTQELPAQRLTEPKPGVYIFDFGQNFAGNVRLKVKGPAGTKLQIRYGEMLHPDGRLMTENLRKARATDFYTLRGDPGGETWTPRFTYHGFQFVEVTGLTARPSLEHGDGLCDSQ